MPGIDRDKILQIIAKHKGSRLFVISKKSAGLLLQSGHLQNVTMDTVSIAESEGNIIKIPFQKDLEDHILHIYNTQNIDLLKAKAAVPLANKLSVRETKKTIFSRLRPNIQKELTFVYKKKTVINVTKGKFIDMGMMGIKLQLPPFYNETLDLNYGSVFHIYAENHDDLLA